MANFGQTSGATEGSSGGGTPANARRMPLANSPSTIEAERKKRRAIVGRSGRASTFMAGTQSYVNSALGSFQ